MEPIEKMYTCFWLVPGIYQFCMMHKITNCFHIITNICRTFDKKNADLLEDTPIICLLIILLQYYNNSITCMFLRFLGRSPYIFNASILLWASLLFVSGWHCRLVYADFFGQIRHLNTLWCLCCGFVICSPNLTWSSLSLQLHLWLSWFQYRK